MQVCARRRAAALAALALALGCSEARPHATKQERSQALVSLDGWRSVERADDPFIEGAAEPPACVGPGFRVESEDGWVEIDTGLCNWVTMVQPALVDVDEGGTIELGFSHYDLGAANPTNAELKLRLGDCDAWSKSIPIPSAAQVYEEQQASPCSIRAGDPVLFHLHNHGQNTYQLKSISTLR
jgi:hypothetical protein